MVGSSYSRLWPPKMPLIRFGEFELDEQTFELRRNDSLIRIQQQPARVLAFLLKHQGTLVSRKQIQNAIWGDDTFVDFEQSLNFCIRQIRITLNDQAEKPLFIETLPRLGYRFIGHAETVSDHEPAAGRRRIRIGVLPIEDLGGPVEDYFAAGLTEDMISALAQINCERLRVIVGPRSPGGSLAREQLDRLQREFDLDYLLRGSVRRSAEAVRITAQLFDLRDQSVLWSEVYDRESSDLLGIQEEVTRRVSQSLVLELLPGAAVGSRKYARSSAAYDAYLKGRFFWHKMTSDAMRKSISCFSEALTIDPKFAPAYNGLADCYAQMGSSRLGLMKPVDALKQARTQLSRAMDIDDTLTETHCTMGLLKIWYESDWAGAEREFERALTLDPGNITALLWQSPLLSALNRHAESIASVRKAMESEPLSPVVNAYFGAALSNSGQFDLGIRQLKLAIELDPFYYRSHMFLGHGLEWAHRGEEAIAAYRRALELSPDNPESLAYLGSSLASSGDRSGAMEIMERVKAAAGRLEPALLVAQIHASLGEANEAFRWLQIAYERRAPSLYIVRFLKCFVRFESDPRYLSFLDQIGLPRRSRTAFTPRGEYSD